MSPLNCCEKPVRRGPGRSCSDTLGRCRPLQGLPKPATRECACDVGGSTKTIIFGVEMRAEDYRVNSLISKGGKRRLRL